MNSALRKTPLLALALTMLLLTASPALAAPARIEVVPETLTDHIDSGAAVSDGRHVYHFGGLVSHSWLLGKILRYDPVTNTVTEMDAELPGNGRARMSAVWTGNAAYLFGGWDDRVVYDDIYRYDPATDTLTKLPARLPEPRAAMSAIWTGEHAYLFGGGNAEGDSAEILRFDPATGAVTRMNARLPSADYGTAAIWDGTHAYVFGGHTAGAHTRILRYDPATDTLTALATKLPGQGGQGMTAHYDGTHAYLFGGHTGTDEKPTFSDAIVRFTPATGAATLLTVKLPYARAWSAAGPVGGAAYIVGGYHTSEMTCDDVCGAPHSGEHGAATTGSKNTNQILRFTPGDANPAPTGAPQGTPTVPGRSVPAPSLLVALVAVALTGALLRRRSR